MGEGLYRAFFRRCVRNLAVGTLLSIVPAGAFYWFIFEHSPRQLTVLCALGVLDLAMFFPVDLLILRWTLRPVRAAFARDATPEARRAGLARLLDSPWIVLVRIYGPHAVLASAGITVLVLMANRLWGLGVPPSTFPLYWVLNMTVIPIAHAVYEFTGMERAVQPAARELAQHVRAMDCGARAFTLNTRMRIFFPLLALAPVLVVGVAISMHNQWDLDEHGGHAAEAHHASADPRHMIGDITQIGAACAALFLYLMWTLGAEVRKQTEHLMHVLDRLGRGELAARAQFYATSEFGQLAQHVNDMAVGLAERERLRELFGAYMTTDVAQKLLAEGEASAGQTEKRYCAILFLDVRGFTRFSSERPPDVVVGVLNRLLGLAVDAVTAAGGNVNKYLGDGLLAVFGAPVHLENSCGSAIEAAVNIAQRLAALNAELVREGLPEMQVGIGVHAGEVVVGTIGSASHKLEYTVIGDPVNVASRIEQLTKKLEVPILVSDEVLCGAGEEWAVLAGAPAEEQVKGIAQPVVVVPIRTGRAATME